MIGAIEEAQEQADKMEKDAAWPDIVTLRHEGPVASRRPCRERPARAGV